MRAIRRIALVMGMTSLAMLGCDGEAPPVGDLDETSSALKGKSADAPGHTGAAPGLAGATPGQSGAEPPGQSGAAVGGGACKDCTGEPVDHAHLDNGATATADTQNQVAGYDPWKAIDGVIGDAWDVNMWLGEYCPGSVCGTGTVTVQFDGTKSISEIALHGRERPNVYSIMRYSLQYYDGSWHPLVTDVATPESGPGFYVEEFPAVNASKIAVTVTSPPRSYNMPAIYEIEAY